MLLLTAVVLLNYSQWWRISLWGGGGGGGAGRGWAQASRQDAMQWVSDQGFIRWGDKFSSFPPKNLTLIKLSIK